MTKKDKFLKLEIALKSKKKKTFSKKTKKKE